MKEKGAAMDNTLYIVWGEENTVGISILDEQHRSIVSTINTLDYYIKKGTGKHVVSAILKILEEYSKLHFETEEDLMKQADYPDYEAHVKKHRKMMVNTLVIRAENSVTKDADAVLQFLKDWWHTHVNIEDQQYLPYVKKLYEQQ
ncbi:bacteriohemerythrin [Candidatus Omnitrophota bacterium]